MMTKGTTRVSWVSSALFIWLRLTHGSTRLTSKGQDSESRGKEKFLASVPIQPFVHTKCLLYMELEI